MKKKMKLRISVRRLRIAVPWLSAYDQNVSKTMATSTSAIISLPPPSLVGSKSLEEMLAQRRSVREFGEQPLTLSELGQLLWAAQGVTNQKGKHTAPSAGRIYPLEMYLVTADGVFHYRPDGHELVVISQDDARSRLYKAAERQEQVRQAPAVFIVTAAYERATGQYGKERAPRYVHLEAGHAAQNLLLEAVALGLGAVPVGAFQDEQVQEALHLPADHQPLYLIPVGHPWETAP